MTVPFPLWKHLFKPQTPFIIFILLTVLSFSLTFQRGDLPFGVGFLKWGLYSSPRFTDHTIDLSWDGGKSFLFRDFLTAAKNNGINTGALFYLLQEANYEKINFIYKKQILQICNCSSFSFYRLQTSLPNYIFKGSSAPLTTEIIR